LEFHATVEHLSSQGFGTIRDDAGRVYFVRATWPGDRGVFRPSTEREGRYQFAELLSLTEPSVQRRPLPVPCAHFGVGPTHCYGCPWIIATETAQEQQKWHRLHYAFERVGLDTSCIKDLWAAPQSFGYRSRAQFKTDGIRVGYAGLQGKAIANIDRCLTLSPIVSQHLKDLQDALPQAQWQPTPPHIWNFLEVDEESRLDQLEICRRRPFQQVNKQQNERMRQWVSDQVSGHHVLELFAGSGNFTEAMAGDPNRRIDAFEVGEAAVRGLESKMLLNVSARRVDLYDSKAHAALRTIAADSLFVNPPRAGLMSLTKLPRYLPSLQEIIYVSCDIQSLVTDLQKLTKNGFHLVQVQPVDQMPQTPHLEVLVKLERQPAS